MFSRSSAKAPKSSNAATAKVVVKATGRSNMAPRSLMPGASSQRHTGQEGLKLETGIGRRNANMGAPTSTSRIAQRGLKIDTSVPRYDAEIDAPTFTSRIAQRGLKINTGVPRHNAEINPPTVLRYNDRN